MRCGDRECDGAGPPDPGPGRLRARYVEYGEGLLRELALVRLGADRDDLGVPDRLLELVDEVRSVYGAFGAGPNSELDAALARGEEVVDVTYTLPLHAGPFVARLNQVLDDAEELCREGRYLLTMPAPPEVAAYRRWSLGEFERQIAGHPPHPWPEEAERLGLTVDASCAEGDPARSGGGA